MKLIDSAIRLVAPLRRTRAAAVVRGVAGVAAGVQHSRRGTVLILVIGALALISVITLVYATIGQGDRRSSASTVRNTENASAVDSIGRYIAGLIADEQFATYVDGTDTAPNGRVTPILIRKAAEYPFTDPYRRSVLNAASQTRRFDPTGTYNAILPGGADNRVPATPFLASTVPTAIGSGALADPPNFNVLHDWLHISNIGPDGRYVNLWNLAPKIGNERYGNLEAKSSMNVSGATAVGSPVAPTINASNQIVSELSYGLTLFDAAGNPTQNLDTGAAADPNIPAHWSFRQQWMFRPATGPMFFANNPANRPDSPFYPPYQFCDTDGDGLFDARWQELVDASDPANPVSLLPRNDGYRWFVAARVVDLGAMVNVNTATDLREPAQPTGSTEATKAGASPSDVDLRRLFLLDDLYRQYGSGYTMLERPVPQAGPDDYFGYNALIARGVGGKAYDALRLALRSNGEQVVPFGTDLANPPGGALPQFTGDLRSVYFQSFGGQPEASFERISGTPTFALSARFNSADLKELLTYWTINNPSTTSRLEQTTGSRFDPANGGTTTSQNFDPLRGNRGLQTERGGNDNAENSGQGNGLPDPDVMARSIFDVRHYITPFNGARPLRSNIVPTGFYNVLDDTVDAKVDVLAALRAATDLNVANRDAAALFTGYADALLPYSFRRGAWGSNTSLDTLHFGGSAEMALRTAAQMAANLVDSYDTDNTPSAYTLIINENQRSAVSTNTLQFPWWSESGNSGKLDLTDPRLAHTSNGDPQPQASLGAVNVYGIEAQPFVTQVVTLFMYTDAPTSAGGDDEYNGTGIPPLDPITINGTPTAGATGNPDYLGQVIAFQLTNPFDTDIQLTKATATSSEEPYPDNEYSDFYLEFAGNLYKLAEASASGGLQTVVLRAGETKVFYCLSLSEADMLARWRAIDPTVPADAVEKYVQNQFGYSASPGALPDPGTTLGDGRVKPIQIRQMNSTTGASQTVTNGDFFSGATSEQKTHVLLWRVMRSTIDTSGINQRSNDMLVDHMRDPGPGGDPPTPTLDRTMPSSNQDIGNTQAGQEPPSPAPEDNTGFTIVLWGSLKRNEDPGASTNSVPRGAIPAYCIEAKWGSTALKNRSKDEGANPSSLRKSDFTAAVNADTEFLPLINKVSNVVPQDPPVLTGVLVPSITKIPGDRTIVGDKIGPNLDTPPRPFNDLYPEVMLNNKKFEAALVGSGPRVSTLRVADLLLPLGVGPMNDPSVVDPSDMAPGWITLSEALGLALNYSNPPVGHPAFDIYNKIGDSQVGGLDRGNLSLTKYVPFEDQNNNRVYDPPFSGGQDRARFPGIPLALNLFNVFTTGSPQSGSLTSVTPGLININTASPTVLRVLPLLSPTTEPLSASAGWQYWRTRSGLPPTGGPVTVPDPSSAVGATDGTDVAATLLAQRDKLPTLDRDSQIVTFENTAGSDPFNMATADGRSLTTRIPGIREVPGLGTPGEIMTLIDRTGAANAPGNTRVPDRDQIDYLGRDGSMSGTAGMTTSLYRDPANTSGPKTPNQIKDDYAEKVAVAAAAMNSITVRSDIFAVWFVVNGYQKSDTENLKLEDPLTPSISKRYLMVVDRSNVVRKGEKPRIIMFTELPK